MNVQVSVVGRVSGTHTMSGRRSSTGITDFLSDLVDDIKDFLDDDILDRGRDTERDLRRTTRNWTDSDDDRGRRSGFRSSRSAATRDVDDLKRAIRALARKIDALDSGSGGGSNLPIAGYDDLTAVEINDRLPSLSQTELVTIGEYERAHADRSTVARRIEALRGTEPWSGYDDQTVVEIRKVLTGADDSTLAEVRKYEAGHKNRQGVLDAAEAS
jgi:hypothetical protein